MSGRWATRLRALQALSLLMLGEHEQSAVVASAVLAEAEQNDDSYAAGFALHVLAFSRMHDRDHAGAIECCQQALDVLGSDLENYDLRLLVLSNYAAALNDADRLAEARAALGTRQRRGAAAGGLPPGDPRWEELSGHLLTALWLNRRDAEAEQLARQILPRGRDMERIGAAAWKLIYTIHRAGRYEESTAMAEQALADRSGSGRWGTRLRALLALSLFMRGEHERSAGVAQAALAEAERAADIFATGFALHVLAFHRMWDHDLPGAITCCRRALDALGSDLEATDLRLLVMCNYAAALNDADRLAEARVAFSEAVRLAEHAAPARLTASRLQTCSHLFESGAWDEVLAELKDLHTVNTPQHVIPHTLRARIALHRDDMATARHCLRALDEPQRQTHWSAQATLDATAEAAEHAGEPRQVLVALAPLLDPEQSAGYVIQNHWLPAAVRAALALGDPATWLGAKARLEVIAADRPAEPEDPAR